MPNWIIVVDDDVTNLKMAGQILSKSNMRVTAVKSGQSLLDYVRENGAPDLILLDINMPEMDGFTTYTKYRELERELGMADTPIVMLTADEDKAMRARALRWVLAITSGSLSIRMYLCDVSVISSVRAAV